MANTIKIISKNQLMGAGLQKLFDKAEGDDRIVQIIQSMRHHGLRLEAWMIALCPAQV
jgi:hypothetical protein